MNHREEVINKFYDHPKFQDREYYSTLTGIYQDERKRNIWGNLVE